MTRISFDNLDEVLLNGENEHVEFKASLPSPPQLARVLASLSNAGGGSLLLGLDERPTTLRPVDEREVAERLAIARRFLAPEPVTLQYGLDTLRGRFVIVDVEPSDLPVAADGVVLTRRGERTVPVTGQELGARLLREFEKPGGVSKDTLEEIGTTLARQSALIDEIRSHQVEADTPLSRWTGYALAGLVGALLSAAISALLA